MADAHIDRIDLLSCEEKHGIIVSMTRRVRVTGLSDNDHTQLLSALNLNGVPVNGDSLASYPNLVVVGRTPRIVSEDGKTVDIDIHYQSGNNEGQDFDDPHYGYFVGEMSANIQQVETNLDVDGSAVVLSHTYPADDPDYPSETKTQGGVFSVYQPQNVLIFKGKRELANPWVMIAKIVGTINRNAWGGKAAHTWMCVRASFKTLGINASSVSTHFMEFEFQYNPDTWNPYVVFIDQRTNKPPENLVEDVGYKYVRHHEEVDFESLMGTNLMAF